MVAVGSSQRADLWHAASTSCALDGLNVLDREVPAMGAASGVVAVPRVLDRVQFSRSLPLSRSVLARHDDPRWVALVDGWARTAYFEDLPTAARIWACRFMLQDLVGGYRAEALDHIRRLLRLHDGTIS